MKHALVSAAADVPSPSYRSLMPAKTSMKPRICIEDKQAGLGLDFIDEMNSVIELVLERPELGAHVPYLDTTLDLRWRLAPRFPYAVVYRIEPDAIRVFAFAHLHRKPEFWMKR